MDRAIIVHGTLRDPSHIDLDEPVCGIKGPVEVTVRSVRTLMPGSPGAVLETLRMLPDLETGDVDELERMIEAGKLSTHAEGLFDTDT